MSMCAPFSAVLAFQVAIYSFCFLTDLFMNLVMRMFPTNLLAASSVSSRMSYVALLLVLSTLVAMFKFFKAYSVISSEQLSGFDGNM